MTIYIYAANDKIVFSLLPSQHREQELESLINNLQHSSISFSLIRDKEVMLSVDINSIFNNKIISLEDFENKILKDLDFFYEDTLGSKGNHQNYRTSYLLLEKKLDDDTSEIIDFLMEEKVLFHVYKVNSKIYLTQLFSEYNRHLTSTNQFIALAQGQQDSSPQPTGFALFPLEIMLKVTGYIDPNYNHAGKTVIDSVYTKRDTKASLPEASTTPYKMQP